MINSRLVGVGLAFGLCVLAAGPAGPIAAAQEQTPSSAGSAIRAIASVQVNFAQLADQEALNPPRARPVPKAIHRPLPRPRVFDPSQPIPVIEPGPEAPPSLGIPSPSPVANFLGLDDSGNVIPPDTQGAVGPNHVMTTLNDRYRIHTRAGGTVNTLDIDTFWAPTGITGVFDPRTLYDPYSGRWIVVAVAGAASASSSVLVGVSNSSDPTGTWILYLYVADGTGVAWADYPMVGFNKNWIGIGLNFFANSNNAFVNAQTWALDYPAARSGTGTGWSNTFTGGHFSIHPAVTQSATESVLYWVENWSNASSEYVLYRTTGPSGTGVTQIVAQKAHTLGASAELGGNILPQSGSATGIEVNDSRINSNAVFRNNTVWFTHTVAFPASATTSAQIQHTAAQWLQVDTSANFLQGGRIVDPTATPTNGGSWYTFPSIAVNASNDVVVGFTRGSSSTFASAGYALRAGTDPAGTMRDPVVYKAGEAKYFKTFSGTSNRWGDYSSTHVDPVNDTDFWTLQEYARLPNGCRAGFDCWGTWWAKVATSADTDGDGLPDTWETQFGLNPNSAAGNDGAAGNPDGDALTNAQEYAQGRHPRGFFTRYFAEGATGGSLSFSLFLALVNPSTTTTALANLVFLKTDGTAVSSPISIAALLRRTVNVGSDVSGLATAEFSTIIESDILVVADRTMKWASTVYGSHAETSIAAPSTTWYLAEGATHSGFDLFYLIQNPGATAATVTVTYLLPGGGTFVKPEIVNANSRLNIWVDKIPQLANTDVAAVLTSNVPVIVERAMYLNSGGQTFGAGHESAGVTAPATSWFLAEGATGNFFDLFVLIANPNAGAATVQATYLLTNGTTFTKSYNVPGNSRFNIWVDQEQIPAGSGIRPLADVAVSTTITSSIPVIVERAMWWPGPTANTWYEAHNSPGSTVTGTKWALADGEVNSSTGIETYILVANTSGIAANVTVTLLYDDGTTEVRTFSGASAIPANSRFNVVPAAHFGTAAGKKFGAIVESTNGAAIVVERAMYQTSGGVTWAAGTNSLATKLQ